MKIEKRSHIGKRIVVSLVSIALYGLSVCLPAFLIAKGESIGGLACLFLGWLYPAWYANPLLLASHVAMHLPKDKDGIALVLSIVAQVLALTTLLLKQIPLNEGGSITPILGHGLGFYLWVASIAITWLFQCFLVLTKAAWKARQAIAAATPPPMPASSQ